jgi:hypothetical protein
MKSDEDINQEYGSITRFINREFKILKYIFWRTTVHEDFIITGQRSTGPVNKKDVVWVDDYGN